MADYEPGTWVMREVLHGLKLWLDLGDSGVSAWCMTGNYEPNETEFIESVLQPGMTFIDIGANIGWFSLIGARAVGEYGVVYSFEPRPDTFSYFARSVRENGFTLQVRLSQTALSDEPGILPISGSYTEGRSPGGTLLLTTEYLQSVFTEERGHHRFDVKVNRLDDLAIEHCDLIKIDVEGAEYRAMRGAEGLLRRFRPIVLSEVYRDPLHRVSGVSPAEYLSFMAELGYDATRLDGGALPAEFPPDPINIVFRPR